MNETQNKPRILVTAAAGRNALMGVRFLVIGGGADFGIASPRRRAHRTGVTPWPGLVD